MPAKSSSNLRSNASSKLQCDVVRCVQLFLTMLGRSALSYLASRISTTCLVALCVLTDSWAKQVFCLSALEMLGLSCRLLIFLMDKRTSSMVIVFSLKSNTVPKSYTICLPMIGSYNSGVPPWGYLTIPGHRCTLLLAEYSKKECLTSPTFLFSRCHWKCSMTLEQPYLHWVCTHWILFSKKRRSPLNPVSRRTLIVFLLTNSLLLPSFGGGWTSFRCALGWFRPNLFNFDHNLACLALFLALVLGELHLVSPKCALLHLQRSLYLFLHFQELFHQPWY